MKQRVFLTWCLLMMAYVASMAAVKGYAVYTEENHTITCYGDKLMESRIGTEIIELIDCPSWGCGLDRFGADVQKKVTKVVFDKSFANLRYQSAFAFFHDFTALTTIAGLQYFNTSYVSDARYMFNNCKSLTSLDLSGFDMSNLQNASFMFMGCENLQYLKLFATTEKLQTLFGTFSDCKKLTGLDISNLNTSSVTNMNSMFYQCESLSMVFLTNFDTSNVTNMNSMFCRCKKLTSLDLSSFNTSKVTDILDMFYECSSLKTIIVGLGWNTDELNYTMFPFCESLVGEAGTTYNPSHNDNSYAHIDGGPSNPGYFTGVKVAINSTNFPDDYFRSELTSLDLNNDGVLDIEEIGETTTLDLTHSGKIQDLTGIGYFTELKELIVTGNKLATMDLTFNKKLNKIYCQCNQIQGEGMDRLVTKLPTVQDGVIVFYDNTYSSTPDCNEMTPEQVTIANEKGWKVKIYNEQPGENRETAGYWLINTTRFPDANFRTALSQQDFCCSGALTVEDVNHWDVLEINGNDIKNPKGIELFTKIKYLYCHLNQIRGTNMDLLIESLPKRQKKDGVIIVADIDKRNYTEGNEMTPEQVQKASAKGWTTKWYYDNEEEETEGFVRVDNVNFPDEVFLGYMQSYVDDNMDHILDFEELALDEIIVEDMGIYWLQGIQFFTELEALFCSGNYLANLSLKKCPKLKTLVCCNNQLQELDFSNTPQITHIDCAMNMIKKDAMEKLVQSLPTVTNGTFRVSEPCNPQEGNIYTSALLQTARNKGWDVEIDVQITTDISTAVKKESDSQWYSLDGRRVNHPQPRHIYIRDGKKVIKK